MALGERIGRLAGALAQRFGYDAAEPKGRRKSPPITHKSEDTILDSGLRSKVQANARDIHRNFSIAAWAIRRHLDYVASFQFHSRTKDKGLDRDVEFLMDQWSRPYNCDAAGRHNLRKMIRLAEARATIDGDLGLLKLASGQLQGIESDRIRNPVGLTLDGQWIHGVKTDQAGKALAYSICNRLPYGGFTFERAVSAANLCLHGHFERYDQVRGVSPINAALNPLRDVYEAFDMALAKAKISQLFGVAITRKNAEDSAGAISNDDPDQKRSEYKVDFGKGPVLFDLDPNDDVKFLESATPSTQFQDFTQLMVLVALKALDIPYSFYDEAYTNFFGSRGAWLHYERACADKRDNLLELLRRLTLWRLGLWILDGELQLPSGQSIGDLLWEWVPIGMPWWDPAKEIRGDLMAIGAGLDNPQRVTKERGRGDWYDNIDRIAEAQAYAREKGVNVSFDPGEEPAPEPEKSENPKQKKGDSSDEKPE